MPVLHRSRLEIVDHGHNFKTRTLDLSSRTCALPHDYLLDGDSIQDCLECRLGCSQTDPEAIELGELSTSAFGKLFY